MKFLIITQLVHLKEKESYFTYEPYVREMNIWFKYVDKVIILAPLENKTPSVIDDCYKHPIIDFRAVPSFSCINIKNAILAVFRIPFIMFKMAKSMRQADYIHLRCPGNMGLLACFLQILFPSKPKTAKYAGNWDPKAKQPWSYRLQKWLLANTFLTRNMKVLVYGEWSNQSVNITPFFTASYSEKEIVVEPKKIQANETIRLLFVGSLVEGKNPLYAIQILEQLRAKQINAVLDIYGEGVLRSSLEHYIVENQLQEYVILHGNQNQEVLKKAYQESHFVVLASKSEGWPKAIAEAMFWGCVPLATAISCVPYMLDYGNRGVLLQMAIEKDNEVIFELISQPFIFEKRSEAAMNWSRKYTLEFFEDEIKNLF